MSSKINHGIIEVATLTPNELAVGDPKVNADYMIKRVKEICALNASGEKQTRVVVFPELALTGYNCGELFNQSFLHDETMEALDYFVKETNDPFCPLLIMGAPIKKDNQLFNCAVVIFKGEILGVVPKTFLPNYTVLYEARYFHPSTTRMNDEIKILGKVVPFTPNLIFEDETSGAHVSAELCEDLWMPIPPSSYHALNGANVVANLSSSNQVFGKTAFRQDLLRVHSTILACGYIYTCATDAESTSDSVFAGHNVIADNGVIKGETKFFEENEITYGEIDLDLIETDRIRSNTFMSCYEKMDYERVVYKTFDKIASFKTNHEYDVLPFVPENILDGYKDVLDLQTAGLARRLKRNNCQTVYLNAKDSSNFRLALIASVEAFKRNKYDTSGIVCVLEGLVEDKIKPYKLLMDALKVSYIDSPVKEGIVIGCDDMTDYALNTCRDSKSFYDVNASIPKTVHEALLNFYGEKHDHVKDLLMVLKNEKLFYVDKYDEKLELEYMVFDFILHHLLRNGFGPVKIFDLFMTSLRRDELRNKVLDCFKIFYKCFFESDFNRRRPDTPKIYAATMTMNDFRMPTNASNGIWLRALDTLDE